MTDKRRYDWTLGALNGAVVVGIIAAVYSFVSGWEFHAAMLLVALPFGLVTTWRVARFAGNLNAGEPKPFRGPVEGFVLVFGVALTYLIVNVLLAHVGGAEPQGWGWPFWRLFIGYTLFYSLIAGFAGAFVGAILETLTVYLVEFRPRRKVT